MKMLKKLIDKIRIISAPAVLFTWFTGCYSLVLTSPRGWSGLHIKSDQAMLGSAWVDQEIPNVFQCLRLCWLFKACTVISFNAPTARCRLYRERYSDVNGDGIYDMQTVRDSDSVVVGLMSASFEKTTVHIRMKNRGCDSRPCTVTQMCAPARDHNKYICLSLGSNTCINEPPQVANAVAQPDGVGSITYECAEFHHRTGLVFVSTCDRSTGRWSPVDIRCTFADCGEPPKIVGTRPTGTSTFYGAQIKYECLKGAAPSSSDSMTITCQASSHWTDPPDSCVHVDCGLPHKVTNAEGQFTKQSLEDALPGLSLPELYKSVGSTMTYVCEQGYNSVPGSVYVSECQADSNWSPTNDFTCTPVDCGHPPILANSLRSNESGVASASQETTTRLIFKTDLGSEIFYTCRDDYKFVSTVSGQITLVSHIALVCGVGGTWAIYNTPGWDTVDYASGCQLVDCRSPPQIDNTQPQLLDQTTTIYSRVNYTCIEPAVSNIKDNNSLAVCQDDGSWTSINFTCRKITCGFAPRVDHSTFLYAHEQATDIVAVTYTCESGYVTSTDSSTATFERHCDENSNEWTDYGIHCAEINCGEPPTVSNANVTETGRGLLDIATYSCKEGYRLSYSAPSDPVILTCTESGRWTSETFTCEVIFCPSPNLQQPVVPQLGLSNVYAYGAIVAVTCEANYVIKSSNNSHVTCTESGWETQVAGEEISCVYLPCGEPPVVDNAGKNFDHLADPQTVTYTCVAGYNLKDATINEMVCDVMEFKWYPRDVACNPVRCGNPPIKYGTHARTTGTTYGGMATFTCIEGYTPVSGNTNSTCQEDSTWAEANNLLQCRIVDCGAPPEWPNATRDFNETTYGSVVIYICADGYESDPWNASCLAVGKWDPAPYHDCRPIQCGQPRDVTNATYSLLQPSTDLGDRVRYTCDPGLFLQGNSTYGVVAEQTCNDEGQWVTIDQPFKQDLSCRLPQCSDPPAIENAVLVANGTYVTREVNSSATYFCNSEYFLWGDHTASIYCQEDFSWSRAYFECLLIHCGTPLPVTNTSMNFTTTTVGSVVTFSCTEGMQVNVSAMTRTCLSTGHWSPDIVECMENGTVTCGEPPVVKHASVNVSSVQSGALAVYTCDTGYRHAWLDTYICQDSGIWSSPLVLCEPVDCGEPPIVQRASRAYDKTVYMSTVTYSCQAGTTSVFKTSTKMCLSSGKWSSSPIWCLPEIDPNGACGYPKGVDNSYLIDFTGSVGGSVAEYDCYEGYLGEKYSISCESGSWVIPASTSCRPIACSQPPAIDNVAARYINGTTYNYFTKYECQPNHFHTGPSIKICQANGNWSPTLVECAPVGTVTCGEPPTLPNAQSSISSRTVNSVAAYTCNIGYTGPAASLTCLSSGQWSVADIETDFCKPVDCEVATFRPLHHALFIDSHLSRIGVFVCSGGYTPIGPVQTTCLATGSWSTVSPTPTCTPVEPITDRTCPRPVPQIDNAAVDDITYTVGQVAKYSCKTGYWPLPINEMTHTCIADGDGARWSDEPIRCESTVCLTPPDIPNGRFSHLTSSASSPITDVQAVYECDAGYVSSNGNTDVKRVCSMVTGWEESVANCDPILCSPGKHPNVANAVVIIASPDHPNFKSEIQFKCSPPYYQSGTSNSSECQASGQWSEPLMTCEPCSMNAESPVDNSHILPAVASVPTNRKLLTSAAVEEGADAAGTTQPADVADIGCNADHEFMGSAGSLQIKCASVDGKPQWVAKEDAFCSRYRWEDKGSGVFPIYAEAVKTGLTVCARFASVGTKMHMTCENTTVSGSHTVSPVSILWELHEQHGHIALLSKTLDGPWERRWEERLDLAASSIFEFCISLNVDQDMITLQNDQMELVSLKSLPEAPISSIEYVTLDTDFDLFEFWLYYSPIP